MHGIRCCSLIVLLVIGCNEVSSPRQQTEAWIESWDDMGMYLPDREQVEFIQTNLTEVTPELAAALSHPSAAVRSRTAYVISEIGTAAAPLGPALLARLEEEDKRLVRMYLVDALVAVKYRNDKVISLLKKQFDALDSENVPPAQDSGYAEVDEKITAASALFVLVEGTHREKYLNFVTQWLAPPKADMNPAAMAGYWERRWIAVNSIKLMRGATEAIPLLEAMLQEADTKPWVSVKVPRALAMLRRDGG